MSYTIYHADGTPVNVPDNAIDTTFYNSTSNGPGVGIGTQLVGRNAINYGAPVAQNFLQMTENFASTSALRPTDAFALQGQLWFNKISPTSGSLFVRVSSATSGGDANWEQVVTVPAGSSATVPVVYNVAPATAKNGDILVITSPTLSISIYAGGWKQVFPAVYS